MVKNLLNPTLQLMTMMIFLINGGDKLSTILVNICIACFACVGLTTAISMIQSIINDHKREKREQEKDKRDLEYHEKRMKDFK